MNGQMCKNHPDVPAVWECVSCGGLFCQDCIRVQALSMRASLESCMSCGGRVRSYGAKKLAETVVRKSFFEMLPSAFSYPFKGSGKLLLVIGVIFFGVLDFLGQMPLGWIFGVVGSGYFTAYMFKIINTSAIGKDELPDWPDVTDFQEDILGPIWQVFLTFVASFWPVVVILIIAWKFFRPIALMTPMFLVLGALYLPMALIETALDTNLYWNPAQTVKSICRTIGPYLVSFIVFCFVAAIFFLKTMLEAALPFIALSGHFFVAMMIIAVQGFLFFYVMVVFMRILGLIYYTNEEQLGWFE
ncbi:MAG: hypothetical protein JW928_09860 [Candidatus Aureabacteria bacterium]|nr:hypothetical protein [Candidatus Auribacterota bacterium]